MVKKITFAGSYRQNGLVTGACFAGALTALLTTGTVPIPITLFKQRTVPDDGPRRASSFLYNLSSEAARGLHSVTYD